MGGLPRLPAGLVVGAVLGGLLPLPTVFLASVLSGTGEEADTALGWTVMFGLAGALGFLIGALSGRVAGRYEPYVACLSVFFGLACFLAVHNYASVPTESGEGIPFVVALVLVTPLPTTLAAVGGILTTLLRRRRESCSAAGTSSPNR